MTVTQRSRKMRGKEPDSSGRQISNINILYVCFYEVI